MIRFLIQAILASAFRLTLCIVVCVFSFFYFFAATTVGLQTLVEAVSPLMPGKLQVNHIEGNLLAGFQLRQLSYRNKTTDVALENFRMMWQPAALLHRRLVIDDLQLEHLHVVTHATKADSKSKPFDPATLSRFKPIIITTLHATDVSFQHEQQPVVLIDELTLQKPTPQLATFTIKTLGGQLIGSALLDETAVINWTVTLQGKHLNPATVLSDWPGNIDFRLFVTGQFATTALPARLTVSLNELQGQLRHYPLTGSVHFHWENQQLTIHRAELHVANADIALSGNVAERWQFKWDVRIPQLAKVVPNSQGSVSSHGTLIGPLQTPTLDASLQADNVAVAQQKIRSLRGEIHLPFQPNTQSSLQLRANNIDIKQHKISSIVLGIAGNITPTATQWSSQWDVSLAHHPYVHAMVTLPKTITTDNYLDERIAASLRVNFPNLSQLQASVPDVDELRGSVLGNLQLDGSLHHPTLQGEINLTEGHVAIPKLGLTIQHVMLKIKGDQTRHIIYSGRFQSGKGSAVLAGKTDCGQRDFPTEMTLKGNNLTAVNLSEYKITLNPDLKLHFAQFKLQIDGSLHIPKAELTPKDFRQTVTLPDDVVFVGAEKQADMNSILSAMPTMRLNVSIDNNAFIHYQDLTTTLGGSLQLSTSPNNPATANGELYTKGGTYHAYGQDLSITEGRLIYTGGILTNPGVNIRAVRELTTIATGSASSFSSLQTYNGNQTLTVGVQILGTMDKPAITLFSQPAGLGQDDILSYLLLGVPRSQASLTDSLTILNATSALNVGGNPTAQLTNLTKKIQTGLGLTELNVASVQTFDPTANQNNGGVVGTTSLVLGKKIADNLYVHYSVSLFSSTPITILNLRYQFSRHWAVQSETSTIDNGADILYSLERD